MKRGRPGMQPTCSTTVYVMMSADLKAGPVVSEVEIETPAGIITSVVTSSSIRAVDLRVGDEAVAMFKSTEVLIGKL